MHLWALASLPIASAIQPTLPVFPRPLQFDLSHQFAATPQDTPLLSDYSLPQHFHPTLSLKAVPTTVYRPASYEALQHARWRSIYHAQSEPVEWVETHVLGPDVTDRHTLAQLARMAANAYQLPGKDNWYELDPSWNVNSVSAPTHARTLLSDSQSFPFGWENDEPGFRGFVFRAQDDSTVVLSIKGTTLQGPTSKKDKLNDNLLFSCCCARVDFSWVFSTVCDCYHWSGLHRRCDDPCLSAALIKESLFYSAGVVSPIEPFFRTCP